MSVTGSTTVSRELEVRNIASRAKLATPSRVAAKICTYQSEEARHDDRSSHGAEIPVDD